MARIELPQSRLKLRRRRKRLIGGLLACAVLAALCAGFVALAHAPFLMIERIEVAGARSVATTTVEARVAQALEGSYLYMLPRRNILLYPQRSTAAALAREYPVFKSVGLHAVDFRTIAVQIVEREAAALWCPSTSSGQAQECYRMDEDGVVYAAAPEGSEQAFVAYEGDTPGRMPKQFLTPERFRALAALASALSSVQPDDTVRRVAVDPQGDARVYFESGFRLVFAPEDESGDVFERFALARKAEPFVGKPLSAFEYLDLRWGDKLYYKAKAE